MVAGPAKEGPAAAERIAFDKAERAEQIEKEKQALRKEQQALEADLKEAPAEEKEPLKQRLAACREGLEDLERRQEEARVLEDDPAEASGRDA